MKVSALNKRILYLAIPNILSNITVPLLGMVDLGLAGHLDDVASIGGIALATTIFNLIYWNFSFLRMGTTGLTAQAHGKDDKQVMGRILSQSLTIGALAGVAILLLSMPLLRLALIILSPDPDLTAHASEYYNIVVLAAPPTLMIYALNGWLIGMQNTWWPMTVSLTTNLLNISISAYLVIVRGLGIQGIALGTMIAQYLSMLLLLLGVWLFFWRKKKMILPTSFHALTRGLGIFFSTNANIFLRTLLMIFVTSYFTYYGTQVGSLTLSSNAILLQFFTIFSYFTDGFAYAAEALVGHHYGGRNNQALRRCVRTLMLWGLGLAVMMTAVYMTRAEGFLGVLTDKQEVVAYATRYLPWVYLIPICGFMGFVWDGVYIGLTATRAMLYSMIGAVAVYFAVLWLPLPLEVNHKLWCAFILYLAVRGLMQTIIARRLVGLGRPFPPGVLPIAYISYGSTILSLEHRERMRQLIIAQWPKVRFSDYYRTPDATGKSDKIYDNCVLALSTGVDPNLLVQECKAIEHQAGERRDGEVPLDLDLVVYKGNVLRPKDYVRKYFTKGYHMLIEER